MPIRSRTRALLAGGVAAAAGATVLQRNHLRRIADDPGFAELEAFANGEPLTVVSADGTQLHAEVFGPDDRPTIVLIHGWTEAIRYWIYVIAALKDEFRLVAYDLRGHAASGPAAGGDYSLARFGDDVDAVVAAAVPDGRVACVAGHSLGATSIAAWAENHDVVARAQSAGLLNTGLGDLLASSLIVPTPAWAKRFSDPGVRAACGLAMADMDLHHALAKLTIPTLVMAGARDRLTPPPHARRIAEELPKLTRLIELPDTGHMGPLERPAEVAAALRELVTEVASGPAVAVA